jgi:hypothetical protein
MDAKRFETIKLDSQVSNHRGNQITTSKFLMPMFPPLSTLNSQGSNHKSTYKNQVTILTTQN